MDFSVTVNDVWLFFHVSNGGQAVHHAEAALALIHSLGEMFKVEE